MHAGTLVHPIDVQWAGTASGQHGPMNVGPSLGRAMLEPGQNTGLRGLRGHIYIVQPLWQWAAAACPEKKSHAYRMHPG
jgi:hypothetical protein